MSRTAESALDLELGPSLTGRVVQHGGDAIVVRIDGRRDAVVRPGGPGSRVGIERARLGELVIVKGFTPGTRISNPWRPVSDGKRIAREYRALTLHAA